MSNVDTYGYALQYLSHLHSRARETANLSHNANIVVRWHFQLHQVRAKVHLFHKLLHSLHLNKLYVETLYVDILYVECIYHSTISLLFLCDGTE